MGRKSVIGTLACATIASTMLLPAVASAQQDRVSATEKGSLLMWSKVDIRYDNGELAQDTFIQITNDYPGDVNVQFYFINGDAQTFTLQLDPDFVTVDEPGWNWYDIGLTLTANQTMCFSLATGEGTTNIAPFDTLDPDLRPDPFGFDDAVIRGFVVAWATNAENEEIRWNHLAGLATIVNYENGAAYEYNAWAFAVVSAVAHGEATGTPGVLNLDGVEYARSFDQLLLQFVATGSTLYSSDTDNVTVVDTELTLHQVSADLRQETEGPITTKAHMDVWNENEVKFSGAYRCVTCWDSTLLGLYDIPNHFGPGLQTDCGKARIDGLASQLCDIDYASIVNDFGIEDVVSQPAALLGVATKGLSFNGGSAFAGTAHNLVGMGFQDAVIQYDPSGSPPEGGFGEVQQIESLIKGVRKSVR